MTFPTSVNSQVTDSVTQFNVKNLGEAPAEAASTLSQLIPQATGIAAQNAVANQQAINQVSQAAVTSCIDTLLGPADSVGSGDN